MDAVSEIKAKLSIEEVVSRYVTLLKAGRNFKALCPFHNEKTPSFFVSVDKQLAYCFGCHRGGDMFKFIQEAEHIDFVEALKLLAQRAGVTLPKNYEVKEKTKRQQLLEIHEKAKTWFVQQLWETKSGEKVLDYLRKKRKLSDETIRKFELGFAPDQRNALLQELSKAEFSKEDILESGLASISSVSGTEMHDRFINRFIIPIFDIQGQAIAFGGRTLDDERQPKYLNSPETPLYHKSNILYGMHAAKDAFRKGEKALLVEGYMDALRCYEKGVHRAVGVCGTAFTAEQARLIKRYTDSVTFFFDGDEAGKLAILRSFPVATAENLFVSVLRPKKGKDPDDWLQADFAEFEKEAGSPPDFFQFLWEDVSQKSDLSSPHEKQKALSEVLSFVAFIKNRTERDGYIKRLAAQFKVEPSFLYDQMGRTSGVSLQNRETFSKKTSAYNTEEYLVGCFLQYPHVFRIARNCLQADLFSPPQNSLYRILEDTYNSPANQEEGSQEEVIARIPEELKEKALYLAFFAETQNASLSHDEVFEEVKRGVEKFLREKLEISKREYMVRIRDAEQKQDQAALEKLLADYQKLLYGKEVQKIHFPSA